jgi:hypothetical protein
MSDDMFSAFSEAAAKTKIAAVCFGLAKLFFFLTIFSAFVNMMVAIINLTVYVGLVATSASLCISELMEKRKIE